MLPHRREILRALDANDRAALLDALLGAWRASRAPELADAVAHVSRAIEPTIAPLGATGPKKALQAWLARAAARDHAELGLLLRDLFDGKPAQIRARLAALDGFADDPRIGACLATYVSESGEWLAGTPVGTAIYKALARHGDGRALQLVAAAAWEPKKVAILAKAIAKHATTALDAETRALLARIASTVDAGPTPGEASFAAATGDASARMVATDQMLEEGSPRGEFAILQQLQKQRPLTRVERARHDALLVAHRKTWMGGVAKILDPAKSTFENGFLVAGVVDTGFENLAKVLDAPEWSTVRHVDLAGWIPELALFRRWPTIVSTDVTSAADFATIATAHPPLALTTLLYAGPDQRPSDDERAALRDAPGLPALEHLSNSGYWHAPSALGWIFDGALARRLRHLSYTRRWALAEFVELLARAPANLARATLGDRAAGGWIELVRDERGRFTRATIGFTPPAEGVRHKFDKLLAALAATAPEVLTSATIDPGVVAPTKAHRARLEEAVARFA